MAKHRESTGTDLVNVARRYRAVVIALIATCGLYAVAIALNFTGRASISSGPCADVPAPIAIAVVLAVKIYAITSVVRLSDQLGDPTPIGVLQFLLVLPILIDVPVLAFNALRARSTLRSAGVNASWWSAVKVCHRLSNELCRYCGYNLTGNRSGICPECGTATGPH